MLPFKTEGMATITKEISITELAEKYPDSVPVLMGMGMHCIGCFAAQYETLEQGCIAHGLDTDKIVKRVNEVIKDKD